MAEIINPVRSDEKVLTLDDIRAIPKEHLPIIIYCDGGSLFGWLIRMIDHSAASHMQILYDTDKIASQWFWLRTINVASMASYNAKLIWNPEWTAAERKAIQAAIQDRLAQGKWATKYDVPGVIGEALNVEWLQRKNDDFCSEFIARMLRVADPDFCAWLEKHPSPTPKEVNQYTKDHNPPYKVYGRHMVDD